jgi:hypothetical protein
MDEQDESSQLRESSVRSNFASNITVSSNLKQNVIQITDDRALLRAKEFEQAIKRKTELGLPVGVLIGIVTTYVTADFHDALGLTKEMWSVIFLLVALTSVGFIIKGIYWLVVKPRVKSAEQFVEKLKGSVDSSG